MRKSELKNMAREFQVPKQTIRHVEKKNGLTVNEVEKLLFIYRNFRETLINKSLQRDVRVFTINAVAVAFVRYRENMPRFNQFLLFILRRRRELISCVVGRVNGNELPYTVMKRAMDSFESGELAGERKELVGIPDKV
jgi:hypothetical protein